MKFDAFKEASFYLDPTDWDQLILAKQAEDPSSVTQLAPFAKDLTVTVELEEGQVFKITGGADNQELIESLQVKAGENYHIEVRYVDVVPLTRLADCIGFAHHAEAVKPPEAVLYSIFRPLSEEETDPGCCLIGCFNPGP